jgi:hypothetical protein
MLNFFTKHTMRDPINKREIGVFLSRIFFTVWSQKPVIICIHKLQHCYSISHNFTEHHKILHNCKYSQLKIIRYTGFTGRITPVFTVSHMRLHEVTAVNSGDIGLIL